MCSHENWLLVFGVFFLVPKAKRVPIFWAGLCLWRNIAFYWVFLYGGALGLALVCPVYLFVQNLLLYIYI